MDPIHVVDGVSPEGPPHQKICPCLRALLGYSRTNPRHVLHPIVLLDLHIPSNTLCIVCEEDSKIEAATVSIVKAASPVYDTKHNTRVCSGAYERSL